MSCGDIRSHILVSCGDSGDIRSHILVSCGYIVFVILLNLWGQEILGHIFLWAVDILASCFKQTNIDPPGSIGHQIVGCMLTVCWLYVAYIIWRWCNWCIVVALPDIAFSFS